MSMSAPLTFDERLRQTRLYEAVLAARSVSRPRAGAKQPLPLDSEGIRRLSRLLRREIAQGSYQFEACTPYEATLDGKRRVLYRFSPTDRVVHGAVARALSQVLEPLWPKTLYSYRTGWSQQRAIAAFAAYVRAHRRGGPTTTRGLYVLRRDVRGYGDSIPVADESPLWDMLHRALRRAGSTEPSSAAMDLLRRMIRPLVQAGDETPRQLARGVPTGSPIQPLICNLYLMELDELLGQVDGGFYARFGDDMLFAHPDAAIAQHAAHTLAAGCSNLGLEINHDKQQDLFFNGAGRPSTTWSTARGTPTVEYLGLRIDFRGRVGLKQTKARQLLVDIGARIQHSARLIRTACSNANGDGRVLCAIVNAALDPRCALAHPVASDLLGAVDDRSQLRQLDYQFARQIAEALSGRRGPRCFRHVPYRTLRRDWGLISLEHRRNQA